MSTPRVSRGGLHPGGQFPVPEPADAVPQGLAAVREEPADKRPEMVFPPDSGRVGPRSEADHRGDHPRPRAEGAGMDPEDGLGAERLLDDDAERAVVALAAAGDHAIRDLLLEGQGEGVEEGGIAGGPRGPR